MFKVADLKVKTLEGFSVKNLQRFPSMEWGENGGLSAELFYNGKKAMDVFNSGDGGCANCTLTQYGMKYLSEIKDNALDFLKRTDENWNKYEFLRNKNASGIDDDDFEMVVTTIEERYFLIKSLKKIFKKGYKAVAIIANNIKHAFLQFRVDDVTVDEVNTYMKNNGIDKDYKLVGIYTSVNELEVL